MAVACAVQTLKDHPAGKPVRDPSLNRSLGMQVSDEAPDGFSERTIAVIPPAVRSNSDACPGFGEVSHNTVPNGAKRLYRLARPRHLQCSMETLCPVLGHPVENTRRKAGRRQRALVPAPVQTPADTLHALSRMAHHDR